MSDIAAEAAGVVILAFFGGGILLMLNVALSGGDVSGISQIISQLALPVVIFAIITFGAVSIFQALF